MDNVDTYPLPGISWRRCESKESDQDQNIFGPEQSDWAREMGIRFRILFNIVLDNAGDLIRLRLARRMIGQRECRLIQQFSNLDEAYLIKFATKRRGVAWQFGAQHIRITLYFGSIEIGIDLECEMIEELDDVRERKLL